MKNLIILILAITFALPAWAGSKEDIKNAELKLKADFPKIVVDSFAETPITGMYEVVTGENVLYYIPDSGHIIYGHIFSRDGGDLTQVKINTLMQEALPLDAAIKIGGGPIMVIEITDPDCPFCRKGSAYLDTREADITRYVFLSPIKSLHPKAEAKAKLILASSDKAQVFRDVMAGKYDDADLPNPADDGAMSRHYEVAKKLKVTGTPVYLINSTRVDGANIPALEKLLSKK